ncbi:hypothetical protein NPX13_g5764 [Xylaria arbuscula]|uniref:Uncharacterized protein n=1 Tax=Xylaria arbuscula TaxID=114810 RepID=A0A9W8NDT3_9PEZI|nr:hypothetical protein NPX13_g5764 [Xylaria arbuscula]
MSSTPPARLLSRQDLEDLEVFRRLDDENPDLNREELLSALRREVGHEPSRVVIRIIKLYFDPYWESKAVAWWKMAGN